ncbi:hypothetical protein AVEN_152894-1 [Araneus ventricosus]|uniref:Uncharacterized protein n=1 Tax=Araneus ventricosus TaxID=182803 RepID=A0A4Y2AFE4_ARAVE|nr:hypothetical protein AVEN_152894-1 [Araneus ventricosus]
MQKILPSEVATIAPKIGCLQWFVAGSKAGHSIERKAKPFVPTTGLYSTYFSRKIRQNIYRCSEVCFETRFKVAEFFPPFTHPPHMADFRFYFHHDLASLRGPNLGKTIVFPLPSQSGLHITTRSFQSAFKLFVIPSL